MKNPKEELREELERELGYISSIFMSQECKGTEMVMPTTELFESADRIELYFFGKQQKIIQEIEKMSTGMFDSTPYKARLLDKLNNL